MKNEGARGRPGRRLLQWRRRLSGVVGAIIDRPREGTETLPYKNGGSKPPPYCVPQVGTGCE
jgi:hypothetical protein